MRKGAGVQKYAIVLFCNVHNNRCSNWFCGFTKTGKPRFVEREIPHKVLYFGYKEQDETYRIASELQELYPNLDVAIEPSMHQRYQKPNNQCDKIKYYFSCRKQTIYENYLIIKMSLNCSRLENS